MQPEVLDKQEKQVKKEKIKCVCGHIHNKDICPKCLNKRIEVMNIQRDLEDYIHKAFRLYKDLNQ